MWEIWPVKQSQCFRAKIPTQASHSFTHSKNIFIRANKENQGSKKTILLESVILNLIGHSMEKSAEKILYILHDF